MDQGNPQLQRLLDVSNLDLPAVDPHLAAIGHLDTGQDLHQGTLACPVFPDDSKYLSPAQLHIYLVQCQNAGESLR